MPENSMQTHSDRAEKGAAEIDATRRSALAKLGIAAVVAYTAPIILRLDRAEANITTPSHCADKGGAHCPK
jgi:hypothetical protein